MTLQQAEDTIEIRDLISRITKSRSSIASLDLRISPLREQSFVTGLRLPLIVREIKSHAAEIYRELNRQLQRTGHRSVWNLDQKGEDEARLLKKLIADCMTLIAQMMNGTAMDALYAEADSRLFPMHSPPYGLSDEDTWKQHCRNFPSMSRIQALSHLRQAAFWWGEEERTVLKLVDRLEEAANDVEREELELTEIYSLSQSWTGVSTDLLANPRLLVSALILTESGSSWYGTLMRSNISNTGHRFGGV
jgi:hypothetical protein